MQVAKWGNSLAVRLPGAVVDALNLKAGDHIDIQIMGEREMAIEGGKISVQVLNEFAAVASSR